MSIFLLTGNETLNKKDEETKEFIKSSVAQADSWLLQTWYNIAKSIMSWFYLTQTDMNGYLQRGTMFVISTEQFKLLLSHANIHLDGLWLTPVQFLTASFALAVQGITLMPQTFL